MSTATWDAALFERQRPYKTTIHAPRSMLLAQRIAATAAPAALTPCYFATAEFCATLLSLLLGALLVILTIVLPNPHFRMQESTRCFSLGVVSCFTLQLLLSNGPGSFVIQACAAVGSFPLAKDLAYEEKWRPPHQWARNPCRAWVRFLLVCPWIAAFSRYLALESAAVINVLSVAASVRLLHIFKTNLTQLGYARALELSIVAVGGIASLRKCTLLPLAEAFVVILVLLNCRHSCLQRNKLVEELKEVSRFPVALIDRSSLKELLKQAEESIWTVPPDLLQEAADLLQEAANSLQAAESCAQTVKQLHSLLQQNEVERLHVELSLSPPYVPVEEIALGQLAILLGRPPKNVCPHEIRKASDAVRAHYDPAAFNSIDSAPANHTPRHKCRLARPPWESDSKAIAHLLLSRAESLLGREETFKRQMNKIKKVADRDHNADRLEGLLKEAGDVIGDQQIEIRTLNDLLASVRRRDNLTLEIDRWMDLAKESRHTVSSDDFEKCLNDAREHGVPNAKCNEASLLIESVRLCEQVNQQLKELLATPPSQLISIHKCQQLIEEAVEAKAPPDEIQAARKVVKHVKIRLAAAKKLREAMSGLPVNLNLSDLMKAYEEAKNAQVSELQLDEALVKISILQDRARLLKSESETYQMLQNMLHRGTDPSSALTKRKLADVLSSAEGLCTQLQNQEMDHINLMKSVEAGRELLGHMHHSEAELRRCTQEADKCPKRIQNALNDAIKFNANKGLIERARELLKEINLRISKAEGELTSALQESRVKYTRLSKAIEEASAALKGVSDGNCTTKIKQLMDRANSALQRAKDRDTWQDRLEGFLQQKLNELSDLSNFKESLDMAKQLDADPELIRQGEVYLSRRQALDRDTTILKGTLRRKAASDEWIRSMNNALEEIDWMAA
ncbi:hypothetical protein AB1Y20_012049 [Prymnesium parvum]|uniref:Uncharacterized protein n=1 Tax=Prymnesium parvum TaxID=97485 RepID=A0AB34IMD3_PRYPA